VRKKKRRCWLTTLVTLVLVTLCEPTGAAEIDSLSARYHFRWDASKRIEKIVNEHLTEGVADANSGSDSCEPSNLYESVKDALGQSSVLIGHRIAKQLRDDAAIDGEFTPLARSVYRDLPFFASISLQLANLMDTVRIGRHEIGLDKFGHFFAEGWQYFERAYLEGDGADAALDWGEKAERTYFGWLTTGAYSYADLTANFNGMRFWQRLLGEHDPLLPADAIAKPYIACRDERWVLQSEFDLDDFVDGAWDEGNNCTQMSTEENQALFDEQVARLQRRYLHRYTCPVVPPRCEVARVRYGEYAQRLLHPLCYSAEESGWDRVMRWLQFTAGKVWGVFIGAYEALLAAISNPS
jgi:hypothetical protein